MSIYSDVNQFSPRTKAVLEDAEAVYQAVFNVMAVRKGERLFRPRFGNQVYRILNKLEVPGTRLELVRETVEAVGVSEHRVILNTASTDIGPDPDNIGVYKADLVFDILGLSQRNFRFQGNLTSG